jgi:protein-S-isoprenylcysteine O-methyltransferase Ste14
MATAMALPLAHKLRREALPLLFFGSVVSTKVYFLFEALVPDGGLYRLIQVLEHADLSEPGPRLALAGMLSYVFYGTIAILFDALVFYSYLIRREPVHRAAGFWETVYPLATVLIPVTGFTLLAIPDVAAMLPRFDPAQLAQSYGLTPSHFLALNLGGFVIGALGAALSLGALWTLKRSFSLMTEVRDLVTRGLYRRIRHPLYMAEIVHMLGIAILSATPVGLWLFALAVAMQVGRAKIEERKLARTLPEYAHFMRSTGFMWPKLW